VTGEGGGVLVQGSIDHLELAGPVGIDGGTIGTVGVHIDGELVVQHGHAIRRNLCSAPEGEVARAGWHGWVKIRLLLEFSLAGAIYVESTIGKNVDVFEAIAVGESIRPLRFTGCAPSRDG
jgi:hypothetical protein